MKFEKYFNKYKKDKKYDFYKELASQLKISPAMVALMVLGKRKPGRQLAQKIEKITEGKVTLYDWLD